MVLFFGIELVLHAFDEVLGAARRGNDPVSHRFAQFFFSGAGVLRDREVLAESVRAVDRHGAGNPYQLAGFDVKDFSVLVIKDSAAGFHAGTLRKKG